MIRIFGFNTVNVWIIIWVVYHIWRWWSSSFNSLSNHFPCLIQLEIMVEVSLVQFNKWCFSFLLKSILFEVSGLMTLNEEDYSMFAVCLNMVHYMRWSVFAYSWFSASVWSYCVWSKYNLNTLKIWLGFWILKAIINFVYITGRTVWCFLILLISKTSF